MKLKKYFKKVDISKVLVAALFAGAFTFVYNLIMLFINGSSNPAFVLATGFFVDGVFISFLALILVNLFIKFKFGLNSYTILAVIGGMILEVVGFLIFSTLTSPILLLSVAMIKLIIMVLAIYASDKIIK